MESLSIVIPTFNRRDILGRALEGYLNQSANAWIQELIVVDDGSVDDTRAVVESAAAKSPFEIRYFHQKNKGPAAARNIGIREARSPLILFTDDDIIPASSLVAAHLDWHSRNPALQVAVLGCVTWAPEIRATPFMTWYGSDGVLFSYAHFEGREQLSFTDFYTCNVSLKTRFLRDNGGFDEEFPVAAYEDIELGFRLEGASMRLLYNPKALAYHMQSMSFDNACRRVCKTKAAEAIFRRKAAGAHYFRQMVSSQGTTRHFAKRLLLRLAALLLYPLKTLMDSAMPLPWGVYRIMFRIFASYSCQRDLDSAVSKN